MTTFIRRISAVSNAIQTIDNEANHLIIFVSIAFDTAEMRRMNRDYITLFLPVTTNTETTYQNLPS